MFYFLGSLNTLELLIKHEELQERKGGVAHTFSIWVDYNFFLWVLQRRSKTWCGRVPRGRLRCRALGTHAFKELGQRFPIGGYRALDPLKIPICEDQIDFLYFRNHVFSFILIISFSM